MAGERRATLRQSVVEGALAAGMVGFAEFWFVADGVRLGAGPLQLSLLVTLPQMVGAIGAVGMLASLRRARHRRGRVVATASLQGLVLLGLAAMNLGGVLTPWGLVAMVCLYQLFGQATGNAWSSWFGDLVPARIRGLYFGRRNRWVHGVSFTGLVLGGLWLQAVEPPAAEAAGAGGLGFAVLFGLAGLLRLASAGLLARSFEPPFTPPPPGDRLHHLLTDPAQAPGRGVLAAGGLMLLAVCVGSPFFGPYMLDELAFSYTTYLVAQGAIVLTKVLLLPAWGQLVDRHGPQRVYRVAAWMIAVIPLPWILADGFAWVLFAQAMSGAAWAAHEVSLLTLTLAATPSRRRSVLLAAQSLVQGGAQLVGGLVGAGLMWVLDDQVKGVFAATTLLRLGVAIAAPELLREVPSTRPTQPLVTRVLAFLPHGGFVRRLVAEPEGPQDDDEDDEDGPDAGGATAPRRPSP